MRVLAGRGLNENSSKSTEALCSPGGHQLLERADRQAHAWCAGIIPLFRAKLKRPPASTTGRTSPSGLKEKTFPVSRTVTDDASKSTVTTWPVFKMSQRRSTHSHG